MNQILIGNKNKLDDSFIEKNLKNKKKFIVILLISILLCLILIIYLFYKHYTINQNSNFSQKLTDNFEISKLYIDSSNNYKTSITSTSSTNNEIFIIGIIEIKSLNINYPILSTYTDDYSTIAPCKIAGPMPNQIGNLCIAAHNYNNSTFFSNISNLSFGEIITIYDVDGNSLDYEVIENSEIDFDNLDCLSQDTNNKKLLTLITCTNINNTTRYMIKAKEKE